MFLFRIICICLPWAIRRRLLNRFLRYRIHSTARIGFSWVYPEHLEMEAGSRIDHLVVAVHLNRIKMDPFSTIGRRTWITGFPKGDQRHFAHQTDREPELVMGEHSAITKNHHIDCTSKISIGRFSTIAGYDSQLLTHSIDLGRNRQDSAPIVIGEFCFIGTRVVMLGGAILPDRCVLGAGAVFKDAATQKGFLYAGVPAKAVREITLSEGDYFHRKTGVVE